MNYDLTTAESIAASIGALFDKYGRRTSHLYLFKMICLEFKLDMKKDIVSEEEMRNRINYYVQRFANDETLKVTLEMMDRLKNNENDIVAISFCEFMKAAQTDKKIEDMKYQKEEISEIIYVPYKEFKKMVNSYNKELLRHDEEFNIIFNTYDSKFDN